MAKKKNIFKNFAKLLKVIIIIILLLILLVIVVQKVSNNKVNVMGFGIYTIITESMIPRYQIGDMIVAKKVELSDLKVGDDVVYQGEVGDFKGKIITHRVIKIDGNIHTKGINNQIEDPAIDIKQVYGKVLFKLGILSAFSKLMNNSILFYFIIFIPFTILVFFDIRDIIEEKRKLEAKKNSK